MPILRSATKLAFRLVRATAPYIAKEETPDKLTIVQTLKTTQGARTMTIDSQDAPHLSRRRQLSRGGPLEQRVVRKWSRAVSKILVYGAE